MQYVCAHVNYFRSFQGVPLHEIEFHPLFLGFYPQKYSLKLLDQIYHLSSKARDEEMHKKLLRQHLTLQLLQYLWSRMSFM